MDTDSAYMALSGPLHQLIRPELTRTFRLEYGEWFPRTFCETHEKEWIESGSTDENRECCQAVLRHDTRTPGLFKEEFRGDGIIALNSKTYTCWNKDINKTSSKGVSKALNNFTQACFMSTLYSKTPKSGLNRGFRSIDNQTFTYEQSRVGLSYFYAKRRVLPDSISTTNTSA